MEKFAAGSFFQCKSVNDEHNFAKVCDYDAKVRGHSVKKCGHDEKVYSGSYKFKSKMMNTTPQKFAAMMPMFAAISSTVSRPLPPHQLIQASIYHWKMNKLDPCWNEGGRMLEVSIYHWKMDKLDPCLIIA